MPRVETTTMVFPLADARGVSSGALMINRPVSTTTDMGAGLEDLEVEVVGLTASLVDMANLMTEWWKCGTGPPDDGPGVA